jgi:DNA (cytosine-5)-methyltransferase 1
MGYANSHANAGGQLAVAQPVPLMASGCHGANSAGIGQPGDPAMALDTTGAQAIAFDPQQITSKGNRSNPQPGEPCHTLPSFDQAPAVAFNVYPAHGQGAGLEASQTDAANAVSRVQNGESTDRGTRIVNGWRVRRLTPLECERLQGFPDGYTRVPGAGGGWRDLDEGEDLVELQELGLETRLSGNVWRVKDPDGPRYKALGNSMAVNCMRWIGRRIALVDAIPRI